MAIDLEPGIYEECGICEGGCVNELGQPCAWCEGAGLVPHHCEEAD